MTHPRSSGSYPATDVTMLFQRLTDTQLMSARIPDPVGHYARTVPNEPAPESIVDRLFDDTLAQHAAAVAETVANTAAQLLTLDQPPTLVSLARAGIPAGVLLARCLQQWTSRPTPHYAVGLLDGLGLDTAAIAHIAAMHPAESIVFVDGWIGKGATINELRDHAARLGVPGRLAALADPTGLADHAGTNEDLLIPHALLNKTVCGLLGRPIHRPDITGPNSYFAAEHATELRSRDKSLHYVESIGALVPTTPPLLHHPGIDDVKIPAAAAIDAIAARHTNGRTELVKAGLSETCRALTRDRARIILTREETHATLAALAEWRDVPVKTEDIGPYRAVAIVETPTW